MKLVEYGLIPTGLADDSVDISMDHRPKVGAVKAVEVVFLEACQSLTGSTRAHGISFADNDEGLDPEIYDAYDFSVPVKRVQSAAIYVIDEPSWHGHTAASGVNAYACVVRGIRQIAAGAMLSTGDLFAPADELRHYVKTGEIAVQQHRSWLHNLQLAEPYVPVPPIRLIENYRMFPPIWDNDEDVLTLEDASFLFGEEHR